MYDVQNFVDLYLYFSYTLLFPVVVMQSFVVFSMLEIVWMGICYWYYMYLGFPLVLH